MPDAPALLSALDRHGVRGVFSDIDDTLTDDGRLDAPTYAALVRLRHAGRRVVLITGRPAGWAATLASIFPIDAAVAENGAVAFLPKPGRGLDAIYLDGADERATWPERLQRIADDVLSLPFAKRSNDTFMRISDVAFDIGETQHLDADEIAQIAARIHAHGARYTASTIHAHATYSTANKLVGAELVARVLWGESEESLRRHYVFVGDSNNDAAAFGGFARSVGVANVARHLPRLDAPPKFITTRPSGAGFVELVDYLLA